MHGIDTSNASVIADVEGNEAVFYLKQNGEHKPAKQIILTENAAFERTPFDPESRSTLRDSVVIIFGAGTGGSYISLELARAGVGELRICDFDLLKVANISRHEGDFTDIGRPKTRVTAEGARKINPNIKLRIFEENLLDGTRDNELSELLEGCNLAIGAMDHLASSLSLNRETYPRGIPTVFGGCYEEAMGGEVFFTLPEENTPCLECLRGGLSQPDQTGEIDYSNASGPDDYEGEPGLHSAVNLVTAIEVQLILGLLLRNTNSRLKELVNPRRNFLLIGGGLGEGVYMFKKPFDIFYQPLKRPRRNCDTHRLLQESESMIDDEIIQVEEGETSEEFQTYLEEEGQ